MLRHQTTGNSNNTSNYILFCRILNKNLNYYVGIGTNYDLMVSPLTDVNYNNTLLNNVREN
jgi:hypothetical protein